jgi:hypothetical protein
MMRPQSRNVAERIMAAVDEFADAIMKPVYMLAAIVGTAIVSALATLAACYFFLLRPAGITLPIPNLLGVVILLAPIWIAATCYGLGCLLKRMLTLATPQ